ncbi:MAG TPA: response regulator [Kofleriaceae bacterium]
MVSLPRTLTSGSVKPAPIIVVADADPAIRASVMAFLAARGFQVEPATSADAVTGLLSSRKVDVLIADLAMRGAGGVDLLTLARAMSQATRTVATTSDLSPAGRDAALLGGAVRVLAKPLSMLELGDAVTLAHDCTEGFHGWMQRLSLIDVLQMYHHAGQSLVLSLLGEVEGKIALQHGELIHAECHGQTGASALIELLGARTGQLETHALVQPIRTITGPFDHVLLDGLRALDESRNDLAGAVSTATLDSWLDEWTERDPLDRPALIRWLAEHAPGAGVWRIDPRTGSVERLDELGVHPEHEIGGTPGSLGWAYELAEATDPTWTRVELTAGAMAVALIRVAGLVLAFARLVTGDAVQRRFQVETAQLVRWMYANVEGAR